MALPDYSMRQLLEAGVHFGHQAHRWNPKMGDYIFGVRNNIHIIDLAQSVPMLHKALEQFLTDVYWGELDYLVVDMPPGTGDVALSIAQFLPRAEVLVVTTPQPAAQRVVAGSRGRLPKAGVLFLWRGRTCFVKGRPAARPPSRRERRPSPCRA